MDALKSDATNYSDQPDALNEHVLDPGDPDGVIAAERQRKWQEQEPASENPRVPYEPARRWPRILMGAFLSLAVIVAAYFLGWQRAQPPIVKQKQAAQNKAERKTSPITTATKHYDSKTYTLAVDYPANWLVSDTDAKLTLTSPAYAMTTVDGSANGHILVTIQNQQNTIAGYPTNGAVAALDSTAITYKNPSGIQRDASYLTYLGYNSQEYITGLYLTGDRSYHVGDNIPVEDIVKGSPLVHVSFEKCAKSFCTGGSKTPLALTSNSWKKAVFKDQISKLLESLVFN